MLFDRNVVVTAGAGTGKTSLLIERALNLIGSGFAPIESIAMITFTEKAAAELRQRMALGLNRLHGLTHGDAGPGDLDPGRDADRAYLWLIGQAGARRDEVRERALAALVGLDGAAVSTIHAFCSEILRRYPEEAGVDPSFQVDEGALFERIFDQEWERFLAEELGPRGGRPEVWERALRIPGGLGAVRDIASNLASFAFPERAIAPGARYVPPRPHDLLGPEARAALEDVRTILDRASGFPPMMDKFLRSAAVFLGAFLEGGREDLAGAQAPFGIEEFRARGVPDPGKRMTGVAPDEMKQAAKRAHDFIVSLLSIDEEAIGALVETAIPLARRSRERLLEAGFVSYDGLLRLTRDLLAKHASIRRALGGRFRTLLVDEFQDTDPLQYEILFFIAETAGEPAADAFEATLAPGRLFIVGDPKQSIYRFRGADMEAYRRSVERVLACGGETLSLTTSFRSPAEIVEPINTLFTGWIGPATPEDSIYEPDYIPIMSGREPAGSTGSRVEIWSVLAEGNAEARRQAEGRAIARYIAENAGRSTATGSPLGLKQIAILLRALTNSALYAEALRREGIPFIVEGGKNFYDRPEVGDLLAWLRAAVNPNDGASVLAVLRSPLGAVPDTELAAFAAAGGRLDAPVGGLADPAPYAGIRRTLGLLETFRRGMRGKAPDEILRAALDETPLALLHAPAFEGAQRLANLRKLVARAGDLSRQGLSLEETLGVIEADFQGERSEGESPLADETVEAVRILSVHKAKGLEYPLVFLPDLGRGSGQSPRTGTEIYWIERAGGGLIAVRLEDGAMNHAWALRSDMNRRHETAEEKRVFYVACTRAAQRLILVNSSVERKAPWRDALHRIGYACDGEFPKEAPLGPHALSHRRVDPPPVASPAPAAAAKPLWAEAAARFAEVSSRAAASAGAPIRRPAGAGDARTSPPEVRARGHARSSAGTGSGPSSDVARLAGTAVHAALERWDFKEGRDLADLAQHEARRLLEGVDAPDGPDFARSLREEVSGIIEGFLASSLPGRLAAFQVLGREVPILYRDDRGATWIGACDLIYRDREETLVAADYKTDHVQGDARDAAARYRSQVEVYVEAVKRAFPGSRVRGEILFVRTGAAVTI